MMLYDALQRKIYAFLSYPKIFIGEQVKNRLK